MPQSISHVMFDFDGTLSWLRHGWPEMMFEVFRPHFPKRADESDQSIHDLLISDMLSLNGKTTIHQMHRFRERVAERGGKCPEPDQLLKEFQHQLDLAIEERSQKIAEGKSVPDEFVIFGARPFLQKIKARGITLIVLSGTIEHRVKHEAGLLGLADFFNHHIYGSTLDHTQFSKRQVIDRILREEKIKGENLLSFGDGPVEISETKAVGGVAIGVCSDENENGSGILDPAKKRILGDAGADALIADYRNADELLERFL